MESTVAQQVSSTSGLKPKPRMSIGFLVFNSVLPYKIPMHQEFLEIMGRMLNIFPGSGSLLHW
jgi:hypothetical protein